MAACVFFAATVNTIWKRKFISNICIGFPRLFHIKDMLLEFARNSFGSFIDK